MMTKLVFMCKPTLCVTEVPLKALLHNNKSNERKSNGFKKMSGGEIITSVGCPLDAQWIKAFMETILFHMHWL